MDVRTTYTCTYVWADGHWNRLY